ncbi:MAG: cation-translocating P-type ATPase, partial [Planctomycetaceae bacterium]|nr:cation-translocating P-type ATPase [Planctomycetaceae bacterium]
MSIQNLNNEQSVPVCCCSVRKPSGEESDSPKESRLSAFLELVEVPFLVLSGLSLVFAFFHLLHDVLPFDAAWVAIVVSGTPFFVNAFRHLFFDRRITVDLLLTTAIFATIISEWLFGSAGGHGHSYIFAGGEVAFIMALGHYLEERTVSKARAGIESLLKLAPKTARRIKQEFAESNKTTTDQFEPDNINFAQQKIDNPNKNPSPISLDPISGASQNASCECDLASVEDVIPVVDVCCGDLLRVLPGESVPADGVIVTGNTSIDQSLITGESLPVDLAVGDSVFGGTVNRFGTFVMQATRVGKDASISNMIRLVREAEQKKAKVERLADSWASFLVPLAILTAVVVGLTNFLFGFLTGAVDPNLISESVSRAVTILVVFCPCSLVLATPTAIIAAIGNASHSGILIRSGETLESLAGVDAAAFDKTGTLTQGEPKLKSVNLCNDKYSERELLQFAASAETLSEHPLAKCVVKSAADRDIQPNITDDFELFRGEGIRAKLNKDGEQLTVGNERMLSRFNILPNDDSKQLAEQCFANGESVIWIAKESDVIGFLSVADAIRPVSREVVEHLRGVGIDIVLLTGDNERAARGIASVAGIDNVQAGLLPEEKVRFIEAEVKRGKRIAMIGDGLNDAPALKTATVGIAMGKVGSDLTINAADVVLMGDDISKLPFLLKLAKKTKAKIISNIWLSMSINFVAIILAATGYIGPVIGALVHNAG